MFDHLLKGVNEIYFFLVVLFFMGIYVQQSVKQRDTALKLFFFKVFALLYYKTFAKPL